MRTSANLIRKFNGEIGHNTASGQLEAISRIDTLPDAVQSIERELKKIGIIGTTALAIGALAPTPVHAQTPSMPNFAGLSSELELRHFNRITDSEVREIARNLYHEARGDVERSATGGINIDSWYASTLTVLVRSLNPEYAAEIRKVILGDKENGSVEYSWTLSKEKMAQDVSRTKEYQEIYEALKSAIGSRTRIEVIQSLAQHLNLSTLTIAYHDKRMIHPKMFTNAAEYNAAREKLVAMVTRFAKRKRLSPEAEKSEIERMIKHFTMSDRTYNFFYKMRMEPTGVDEAGRHRPVGSHVYFALKPSEQNPPHIWRKHLPK
jgi:hypothetical protein